MLSDYKTAVNKNSKKFVKSRDGVKKISNKPKVGMVVWTSLQSSHNIKCIMLC